MVIGKWINQKGSSVLYESHEPYSGRMGEVAPSQPRVAMLIRMMPLFTSYVVTTSSVAVLLLQSMPVCRSHMAPPVVRWLAAWRQGGGLTGEWNPHNCVTFARSFVVVTYNAVCDSQQHQQQQLQTRRCQWFEFTANSINGCWQKKNKRLSISLIFIRKKSALQLRSL